MRTEKEIIKRKQIRTIVVLLIFVVLCGVGIARTINDTGRSAYAGLNFDKYIVVPDYKEMEIDLSESDEDALQRQIWSRILSETEVKKYPKKQVKKYYKKNLEHYETLSVDYGYETFTDYVKNEYGIEMEAFEEQLMAYAESEVKNDMLVYAIAEKEGITIGKEEYEKLLEQALKDAGMDRATFEEQFGMTLEAYAKEKNLEAGFLQNKVLQVLAEDLQEA